MVLLIPLKILSSDCEKLVDLGLFGAITFCPESEKNCFINFVNEADQIKLVQQAMNCGPIVNAIGQVGAQNKYQIQDNASMIVNEVIKEYIFNSGGSCRELVEDYISFAAKSCPNTLVEVCQKISKAASFNLGTCLDTLKTVKGGVDTVAIAALGFNTVTNTLGSFFTGKLPDNPGFPGEFCLRWKERMGFTGDSRACSRDEVTVWSSSGGVCPGGYVLNHGCSTGCKWWTSSRCPNW